MITKIKEITKNTSQEEVLKQTKACSCEKCSHGCTFGSGTFTKKQIKTLSQFLNVTEQQLKEKYLEEITKFNTTLHRPKIKRKNNLPYGKCIFFKKNKCSIHAVKPLECKTSMGCTEEGEKLSIWFTLNHFVNAFDPQSIREWDAYLKQGSKTIEGGKTEDLVPNKKTREKILNYEILK